MREPVRLLVCRGHETITELTSYDRCNSDQEKQESKGAEGVSRRTDDQLLAQVQGKNAESILGRIGAWPASSGSAWPSACSRPR